ncbi:hypothetical protein GWK47_054882 [Chionoecetes opilio]|uniref:Uncharacterized protein n=1 Tax=Chionoecetes opilio TaxID=41210 RepID=A0A8J4Y435_CHIOP|nr:hypothetical protein GWK47_054882 [Chionoecetes opilio]
MASRAWGEARARWLFWGAKNGSLDKGRPGPCKVGSGYHQCDPGSFSVLAPPRVPRPLGAFPCERFPPVSRFFCKDLRGGETPVKEDFFAGIFRSGKRLPLTFLFPSSVSWRSGSPPSVDHTSLSPAFGGVCRALSPPVSFGVPPPEGSPLP